MSFESNAASRFSGREVLRLGVVAVVSAALVTVIVFLAGEDRDFRIVIDPRGGFDIAVGEEKITLAAVLDTAMEANQEQLELLLAERDYYHIRGDKLENAVRRLGQSPDDERVVDGLRRILWNREGPFEAPEAFAGADARLIAAIEDLEGLRDEVEGANHFLTLIWQNSVDRTSIFRRRDFRAEVVPIAGLAEDDGDIFYACAPNELLSKSMTLKVSRTDPVTGLDEPRLETGRIAEAHAGMDCRDADRTLRQILADHPVRVGVDPRTYEGLFVDDEGAVAPPVGVATFKLYPSNLTASVQAPR